MIPSQLFADIDECEKNNGGCVLECFNEPGHHTCECQVQCQPGYVAVDEMCVRKYCDIIKVFVAVSILATTF